MFSRRTSTLAGAAAIGLTALALGGCGGSDDDGDNAAGSASPRPAEGTTKPVTRTITGGTTTLRLDPTAQQLFDTLGVDVSTTGRASSRGGKISLPIEGGRLDLRNDSGRIEHAGGLKFTAGGRGVTAADLVLSPEQNRITAEVDGRRVPLFSVELKRPRTVPETDAIVIPGNASVLSTSVLPESVRSGVAGAAIERGLRIGALQVSARG